MKVQTKWFATAGVLLLIGAGCTVNNTVNTNTNTASDTNDSEVVDDAAMTSNWTDATDQGDIAAADVAGTINGEEVEIVHVQIEFDGEEYDWSFSDKEFTNTCGFATGNNEVNLRTKDLQVGTFMKGLEEDVEFDEYHSYYVYAQENGSPFSVNTDWEANVVVTDIERALEEGPLGEDVGTVSGFANISFGDGLTEIDGAFEAEFCEDAV